MTPLAGVHAIGSRKLPEPRSPRFQPLRAGIRNVWEYDDQEFWFAGGRLILRGPNTAGKSKALELLLPFVLDGETRPERLDPFGGRSKTMYWNLIDFNPERRSEIGYCWLEFGRVDGEGQDHFVTCVVGMRATRGSDRKVETWFAVTPQRVGVDLEFRAPDRRLLAPDRFKRALDGRSTYSSNARDHRRAVDLALFGLGTQRFDSLIHLLLQLRQPKLSEKLNVAKLTGVLSDALPPLEHHRLELLARNFARLDADAAELERLQRSCEELARFLDAYRNYARVQVRLAADGVRTANNRLDEVTRTEREQSQQVAAANAELSEIEQHKRDLETRQATLQGQLDGLDLSKAIELSRLEDQAVRAERAASQASETAGRDARSADRDAAESSQLGEAAVVVEAERDSLLERMTSAGAAAGLEDVARAHRDRLISEPRDARRALEAAAERHKLKVFQVRAAAGDEDRAVAQVNRWGEHLEEAEQAEQESEQALERASRHREDAESALSRNADAWVGALAPGLRHRITLPDQLGARALEAVLDARGADAAGRDFVRQLCGPARKRLSGEQAELLAGLRRLEEERNALGARREAVANEQDDAPAPTPGRPANRPDGLVPLWRCVDFHPSLDPGKRAGLEAALEAAGLLDALVSPEGRLVDPEALDTAIAAGPAPDGRTLNSWLLPDGDLIAPSAVQAALATVSAGDTGASNTWVAFDGRWAVAALSGRWGKPQACFVGASARAAARKRRLTQIDTEIAELEAAAEAVRREHEAIVSLAQALDRAEQQFPGTGALRDLMRDEQRMQHDLVRMQQLAAEARTMLTEATAVLDRATAALRQAEQAAGCRAGAVDGVLDAIAGWREALIDAAHKVEEAARAAGAAARALDRARSSLDHARESASHARQSGTEAARLRAEFEERRQAVGADVEAVLARKAELDAALAAAGDRLGELSSQRDAARDRISAARTELERARTERIDREDKRTERLQALAGVGATELAELALGPLDSERDLTQVTAGLGFARSAADRLSAVATDQAARDRATNRLHDAYSDLRSRLASDFDPHLDTREGLFLCFARLNGNPVGAIRLAGALEEQVSRRREMLSVEERDIIEQHLMSEVGSHLGERIHAAWTHVHRMNEQLAQHPTRSGVLLKLAWEVHPDAGGGASEALKLLRREVGLLTAPERELLGNFLAARVRAAREEGEGVDTVQNMADALDYRRWHHFTVMKRTDGKWERFTSRTQGHGSGGEQAKLAHLPLFAATAGYYATASAVAPRLLMLDEAFAGIDDDQRADCLGMLVELDLDVVLTNFNEWGCYPQVPAIAIYHLERVEGQKGVAALRYVWDGRVRREHDPFFESLEPEPEGLLAPEVTGG